MLAPLAILVESDLKEAGAMYMRLISWSIKKKKKKSKKETTNQTAGEGRVDADHRAHTYPES
jgi:hypothetical protein